MKVVTGKTLFLQVYMKSIVLMPYHTQRTAPILLHKHSISRYFSEFEKDNYYCLVQLPLSHILWIFSH